MFIKAKRGLVRGSAFVRRWGLRVGVTITSTIELGGMEYSNCAPLATSSMVRRGTYGRPIGSLTTLVLAQCSERKSTYAQIETFKGRPFRGWRRVSGCGHPGRSHSGRGH